MLNSAISKSHCLADWPIEIVVSGRFIVVKRITAGVRIASGLCASCCRVRKIQISASTRNVHKAFKPIVAEEAHG